MKYILNTLKNSKGAVAIEFALVLPFLFLLLSGVINFGFILANQNLLNNVASAGILYAFGNAPNPNPSQTTLIQNAAIASTPNLTPLTINVTQFNQCVTGGTPPNCSDGSSPSYITVTATSSVNLMALDFVLPNPFTTQATGTIRTQ